MRRNSNELCWVRLIIAKKMSMVKKASFLTKSATNCLQLFQRHYQTKVVVNEFNIAYEKVGQGPLVVGFLPGAFGSAETDFGPQLKNLDQKKFTLICWDPPGYGASRPPEREVHNFRDDATAFSQLMEILGHRKYSLVGWSNGAATALIIAGQKPECVQKLVTIAGKAFITDEDRKALMEFGDISKWSPRMREPLEKIYGAERLQYLWSSNLKRVVACDDLCQSYLPKIECPALIVHGEKDRLVPKSHSEYLAKNIKKATLKLFPEGSHNVHLRFYKEFNSLLEKFLLN